MIVERIGACIWCNTLHQNTAKHTHNKHRNNQQVDFYCEANFLTRLRTYTELTVGLETF